MTRKRLHWWKSGSKSDVAKAMRLQIANGDPYPASWESIAFVNYVRAAFCYEHEARVRQKKRKTKLPVFRFKKPFPELSQSQKDSLRREFPSLGWKPLPWERSERTTPPNKLAEMPPAGWIDIHFWVDPGGTDKSVVLKEIGKYFDEQKKSLGIKRQPNSKTRTKPYSWKSIEVLDAYLNGTAVADHDKSNARLVLKRSY
jgi:hypothetical protein